MAVKNDVRLGRLTTSDLKPTRATLVYGLDASQGSLSVVLSRFEPPPVRNYGPQSGHLDLRCSETVAETPKRSTGMTYFVFDVSPGHYKVKFPPAEGNAETFFVPAGRQAYIGDFVGTPEGQAQITEMQASNQDVVFSRDLATAKAALGPKADRLELAETGPPAPTNVVQGFVCTP